MSQWGRPRHAGTRHNRRVRGGGTWAEQDRRLSRHQLGRLHRKKGHAETWSGQVQRLDRRSRSRRDRSVAGILILGMVVAALSANGTTALAVLVVIALFVIGWRRKRPGRR